MIFFEIQLQDDRDLPKNHFFHPDFFSKAEPRCSSGHLKEQNLAERTWEPRLKKRIFFEQSIIAQLDGYAIIGHNDYPVIAPAFAASLATLVGGWNNIFPKLAFLLMFFPPLILSIKTFNVRYHLLFLTLTLFILNLFLINGLVDGLVAIYFSFSSYLVYDIFVNKQNSFYYLLITFCFFIILSLLKNEGIVMVTILLSVMIIINISKKEMLQNYKKIIFLLFSLIPILIWKITCINYNVKNDIINYDILNDKL